MRVFLYEHVTGGGLMGQPLPASLAREGEMMLRAALDDLTQLPGVEVVISRDPRLPSLTEAAAVLRPAPGESWRALYLRGLALAELVWPIAPETGGVLETLTQYAVAEGRRLLGCTPQAVRVAASKHATACVLARAGIPVVPTFAPGEALPDIAGPWVVKPDDGAGCEGARRVADVRAARHQLMAAAAALVAQPWIEGEPASLSLLVFPDGRVELLACNRQHVALRGERLVLAGVTVNATADTDGRMRGLAQRIVRAIPGLAGFVGVDYLLTADGPLVLEVNPRLTTSYCGLKSALGVNPAALLLGAGVEPERLGTATGPVTPTLDAAHA